MKKLIGKLNRAKIGMDNALYSFLHSEKGDTNFISIAIILVVVIVIAVALITFADDIKASLDKATADLKGNLKY